LEYKQSFRLYDTALGEIAKIVRTKYPDLRAIDIGANVGDSAALIRNAGEIPVLCIEGDPVLLPVLDENALVIGPGITIERSFVGLDGQAVDPSLIDDLGRNASLVAARKDEGPIKLRSLKSILQDHPTFCKAKLLKTDTEGCDFDILRQSIEFVANANPVIFFEYDPHFRPGEPRAGLDTIKALAGVGYSDFIYYDNFGNFLVHVKAAQFNTLTDLHNYLVSNRSFGVAVYYFDVCAFHQHDADLAVSLRSSAPCFHLADE
jgi:FkbM family methyltransferase